MKLFAAFILFFLPIVTFAQIQGEDEVYLNSDRIEATFHGGGMEVFNEYVGKHFDNSKVTKPGKMIASFTIDIDGRITNIRMVQMIDVDSATEMIRVLNECPKWEPAKRAGKPIAVDIKYPMVFRQKNKK